MNQLLQTIISFPPSPPPPVPLSDNTYDWHIKTQITVLRETPKKQLLQKTASGDEIFNIINPALNSIPYAFALLALSDKRSKDTANDHFIWQKHEEFLHNFDARQIRYIGYEFSKIMDFVIQRAKQNREPGAAVPIVARALLRLDPEGSMLTSIHCDLVRIALETRTFDLVPAVISRPVLYFPGKLNSAKIPHLCDLALSNYSYITPASGLTGQLKSTEVLEYFLFCGCIFIALRQWKRAVQALEDAICYPCKDNATSKIMVDAYKKWILASLMWKGKVGKLPTIVNAHTVKSFHAICKAYEAFADIFKSSSAARLKKEAEAGRDIWKGDCNLHLIMEVLGAFQKHQIRRLSNVYTALSISEITQKTFSAETGQNLENDPQTEQLVREMIAEGSLNASVRQDPGGLATLTFEPVQAMSELEMAKKLEAAVQSIQTVTTSIKQTDHKLTEDKEYLKWAHKQRKQGSMAPASASKPSGDTDMTWAGDVHDVDEDLMSGF